MIVRDKLLVGCALAALLAMPALAAAPDQSAAAQSDEAASGGDIVVTASKREERLKDVPSAVTALSGKLLEQLGANSFRDYAALVPGLSQRVIGAPGTGAIILRGLNTGSQQTSNTTSYYIDDTPFSSSGFLSIGAFITPEPELANVERIEVLKGPQSTLYGASSLGGVIHLVTRSPDLRKLSGDVRAEVTATQGGALGGLVRGSLNVPIVEDKLAIQATGFYRHVGGYTDNVRIGTKNVNSSEIYGGRLALRAKPSDNLTIDISAMTQRINSDGYPYETIRPGTDFAPTYGKYQYSSFIDPTARIKYSLVASTITYDTPVGVFTGSGSYAHYDLKLRLDYTANFGVYVPLLAPLYGYTGPSLAGATVDGVLGPAMSKYSGELRFTSKRFGPIEFLGGLFYTSESNSYPFTAYANNAAGVRLTAPFGVFLQSSTLNDYREYAGYGDATLYLKDNLDVQGGVRFAHNRQTVGNGINPNISLYQVIPLAISKDSSGTFSDSSTTYLATLRWRPTRQISTYLRYATGYRPGGPQTANPLPVGAQTFIKADTVQNYEGGIKASFGRLQIDASIYRINWNNVQLNSIAGPSSQLVTGNGGKAKVDGVELEAALPVGALQLRGAFGYTKARLVSIDAGASAALGAVPGDALPGTSKYKASLLADYRFMLSDTLAATVGGTMRYQSSFSDQFPARDPSPLRVIPGYSMVDLRAGLAFSRYTLDLRVSNLTNKLAFGNYASTNFQAITLPPRTYTLAFGAHF